MTNDEPDDLIEEWGIRLIEGSFDLDTGKLDELRVDVLDVDSVNKAEKTWYTIVYDVNYGQAVISLLPEIRDPDKLATILTRSDIAVRKIDRIKNVFPWYNEIAERFSHLNIEEMEIKMAETDVDDDFWKPD